MHVESIQNYSLTKQSALKFFALVACVFFLVLRPNCHAQQDPFQEKLYQMTLEQRVAQTFIWGFSGTRATPALMQSILKYQPGALIAFKRNIESVESIAKFNISVKRAFVAAGRPSPFIMVDQEGGIVSRLQLKVPVPSALALARTQNSDLVKQFGMSVGELLAASGFSVNLAPVMDIATPNKDSFIGSRAFGDNPERVAEMSAAFADGLASSGILSTAKHFPGHGGINADSHRTTPKKLSTSEELNLWDLVPFKHFSQLPYNKMVMIAHIAYPGVDPSSMPATYSSTLIKGLLKDQLKFSGLVITDDLEMHGAYSAGDIGERAVKAFEAGNDMLMFAGTHANQKHALNAIVAAVRNGRIPEARLNDSVLKILRYKGTRNRSQPLLNADRLASAVHSVESLSLQVMKENFVQSVHLPEGLGASLQNQSSVTVYSSSASFYNYFKNRYSKPVKHFYLSPKSLNQARREIFKRKKAISIFYASGSATARWLSALPSDIKSKIIVVNCNHPGELSSSDDFLTLVQMNTPSPESGAWLAHFLNRQIMEPDLRQPASQIDTSASSDE